jgi:GcrA cell cycle regulator
MEGSSDMPRPSRRCTVSQWTDERTEYLKRRWSQGARIREIARELGQGITNNAVVAKIHRLGIADLSPYGGAPGKRTAKKIRGVPERTAGYSGGGQYRCEQRPPPAWVANARPYVENPLLDAGIPLRQRRSLLELSGRTCRRPVGDPSGSVFFFCGAKPVRNKPYCAAHCARAYRRPRKLTQRVSTPRQRRATRDADTSVMPSSETADQSRSAGERG